MDSELDDVFCVPEDGHILNDGEAALDHSRLPSYQPHDISRDYPLTLTDCHLAIQKIICQARFIGFEIARKQLPFFKRTSRQIMLQGDPREFDTILAEITEELDESFYVDSIQDLHRSQSRLTNVLVTPVKAHNDFGASSVKLKRSLLRIEKNFGQNIIEPLKKAMINKSTPEFPILIGHASRHEKEILTACRTWSEDIEAICTIVKSTEGWREASELDKKIEDLLSRASAIGWDSWRDPKFDELHPRSAFDRANGPSSVIAYLEGVLDSANVPRGICNRPAAGKKHRVRSWWGREKRVVGG